MNELTAIILGGGRGKRLMPLTLERAKPAVGFLGKYRLIDIPISNCIHSNIKRIFVLTQFLSASLHRHIMQTYQFDHFTGGFVDILAAEQRPHASEWFQGTADAVRATLGHTAYYPARHMLVLSGDQLYRMDYRELLETHRRSGADITLAAVVVDRHQASGLGIMRADASGRIQAFREKPETDDAFRGLEADRAMLGRYGMDCAGPRYLASMGIYVFNWPVLRDLLDDTSLQDFGADVMPVALERYRLQVHPFAGYWRDIGTVSSFYDANISLSQPDPPFDLYAPNWPFYTHARSLPPNRIVRSEIRDTLVVEGCRITGAHIADSVVGMRGVIDEDSRLDGVVMLGNDTYDGEEGDAEADKPQDAARRPPLGVGKRCRIERAILDKNVRIGDDVTIRPAKPGDEGQYPTHWVRDGITIVPKDVTIPSGTTI